MSRCECEISAVLTEQYRWTRDVPYGGYGGHSGHGGHGRRGAGRCTRRVTSPITELTTLITTVTAPVTAIKVPITAVTAPVTAPVTAVTAPITVNTTPARRAVVGMPERGWLRVQHRQSRASEAATRQAWRVVGVAGRACSGNRGGVSRRGGSFHQGWAGGTKRTMQRPTNSAPRVLFSLELWAFYTDGLF